MADKFRKGKSNFATTLVTGIGTGTGDTITLNSTTGLPTDTEITLTFNRVTSGGVVNSTSVMERITGTISGATLTSYTRGVDGTTEQAHAGGVVVEYIPNAADMNDQVDGILVEHNQDGTHNTTKVVDLDTEQTLTNKTLTTPVVASMYQDAGKTKLMTLPDTASDTIVTLAATQTLTNKTIGDTLNVDGAITQSGTADHITITPGTSKLVKIAVLRQDITTSSYENNSVIVTGWGFLTCSGGIKRQGGVVGLGITFAAPPVVLVSLAGYKSSDATAISQFINIGGNIGDVGISIHSSAIGTEDFYVQIIREAANLTDGWRFGYTWIAIGVLS